MTRETPDAGPSPRPDGNRIGNRTDESHDKEATGSAIATDGGEDHRLDGAEPAAPPADAGPIEETWEWAPETKTYRIGDPVMDKAQGRPMTVVNVPDQTVVEWSDANGYDLRENYGNAKFNPRPSEGVVECVYVSDIRSEPSKTYTFPASRVTLIDVHHADDGHRIADRVVVETLEALFHAASGAMEPDYEDLIGQIARDAGFDADLVSEARELSHAATFGEGGEG